MVTNRTNLSFIIVILSFLFFLLPAATAAELRTMTFLPQWLPQAQFAGYYVAYEKGFYRKHGIDLKILKGGPDFPVGEMLGKNRTDFTTMFLSEGIQQRDKKIRLVNIGQLMQRSGFILVAKKGSGISKPADLQNKKVSMWPNFQIQPRAFFRKYGIEVKPVSQGATVNLFLRGGVDAA
ncbi:MAG: ABC transporter substrate-binding protein, partial [Syntrophus sp. (in: bacteria)]